MPASCTSGFNVITLLLFSKGMIVRTTVRKIGNSRGVLIPAALLAACRIEDEIELHIDDGRLVIEPVRAPRAGWFDNFATSRETTEAWPELLSGDDKDWVW
jgi:antitoxin MazE